MLYSILKYLFANKADSKQESQKKPLPLFYLPGKNLLQGLIEQPGITLQITDTNLCNNFSFKQQITKLLKAYHYP